jgi:hypothetical protein
MINTPKQFDRESLLAMRERMQRYAEWEKEHISGLDIETRIRQTEEMMKFGYETMPKEKIEEIQLASLNNKIEVQKRFRLIYERMKERDRFKESVESGLKDIEDGKTVSMEEVKRIISGKNNL